MLIAWTLLYFFFFFSNHVCFSAPLQDQILTEHHTGICLSLLVHLFLSLIPSLADFFHSLSLSAFILYISSAIFFSTRRVRGQNVCNNIYNAKYVTVQPYNRNYTLLLIVFERIYLLLLSFVLRTYEEMIWICAISVQKSCKNSM